MAVDTITNYDALINSLKSAGFGGVVTDNPFASLQGVTVVPGQAGITMEAYSDLISQGSINAGSGVYQALKSSSGNVLGYLYRDNTGVFQYSDDLMGQIDEALNSNVIGGSMVPANRYTSYYGTDIVPVQGSSGYVNMPGGMTKYNNGVATSNIKTVLGSIGQAVLAAGTGISLGKAISGGIYNIGTALGQDWWQYNPQAWSSITKDDDSAMGKLFNLVFGIDSTTGNLQTYVDINAMAYMAQLQNLYNWFQPASATIPSYNPQSSAWNLRFPNMFTYPISPSEATSYSYTIGVETRTISITGTAKTYSYMFIRNNTSMDWPDVVSTQPFSMVRTRTNTASGTVIETKTSNSSSVTIGGNTYYYIDLGANFTSATVSLPFTSGVVTGNTILEVYDLVKLTYNGDLVEGSTIPGLDNNGGTTPNTTGWSFENLDDVVTALKTQYPDLWNNRISNTVTQPDGTQKTYDYVPFIMPNGITSGNIDTSTNSPTQTDYSTDNSTATQLQTLIEMLTNPTTSTLSNPDTATQTGTNQDNPTATQTPPDTGSGDGSADAAPTGSASSLWAVYNPSQTELNSFGSWLWSSNFVEQLKKLFNDPMQAIIGVHKVYATPPTSGSENIKCGYLDSGVSASKVSSQYTSIDCGSVTVREYFGNVFDYEPYTKISVYLPFIGVVPLKTSEVMRGKVSISYGVDVITGACLAKVNITRDNAGGILYSYGGSCACHYPISSGSYSGIVSGVLTAATGIAAGVATGNPLAAVGGVVAGAKSMHANVQHSGGFTGCAGAMGPKVPYLIIERPQPKMATGYEGFEGMPANSVVSIGSCSGYAKFKEVHAEIAGAYDEELTEIEALLKSGIIV